MAVLKLTCRANHIYTGLYEDGDFVVNFHGCQRDPERSCELEMGMSVTRWRELRDQQRRQ